MRKHISEDGKIRNCTAKTEESCTAKGPGGEKAPHFPEYYAAKEYLEKRMNEEHGETKTFTKTPEVVVVSAEEINRRNETFSDIEYSLSNDNWASDLQKGTLDGMLKQIPVEVWEEENMDALKQMSEILENNKKLDALKKTYEAYPDNEVVKEKYIKEAEESGYVEVDKFRRASERAIALNSSEEEFKKLKNYMLMFPEKFNETDFSSEDLDTEIRATKSALNFLNANKFKTRLGLKIKSDYEKARLSSPTVLEETIKKIKTSSSYVNQNPHDEKAWEAFETLRTERGIIENNIKKSGKTPELLDLEFKVAASRVENINDYVGISLLERRQHNNYIEYNYEQMDVGAEDYGTTFPSEDF